MLRLHPPLSIPMFLCILATPALAVHIPVTSNGGEPGSFTIQEAVDQAADGDQIDLAPGTYTGSGNRDVDLQGKAIVVAGPLAGSDAIIDCGGSENEPHRGFVCRSGESESTELRDVTVTGGFAPDDTADIPGGGAVLIESFSSPSFTRCTFRDNVAGTGSQTAGGAVYANRGCQPRFTDCVFESNQALYGGAVGLNHGAPATFVGCRFASNLAERGGVIWGNPSTKINCVFVFNLGVDGGVIWQNGFGIDSAEHCTFAFNGGTTGAVYHVSGNYDLRLHACVVAQNHGAAGIQASVQGEVALTCTDLFGNEGGDWIAPFAAQIDAAGNFSAPPCFCDEFGGDVHLCADSYCLPGFHPWGCHELVGALDVGCGTCGCSDQGPVANEARSWGYVKSLYR